MKNNNKFIAILSFIIFLFGMYIRYYCNNKISNNYLIKLESDFVRIRLIGAILRVTGLGLLMYAMVSFYRNANDSPQNK